MNQSQVECREQEDSTAKRATTGFWRRCERDLDSHALITVERRDGSINPIFVVSINVDRDSVQNVSSRLRSAIAQEPTGRFGRIARPRHGASRVRPYLRSFKTLRPPLRDRRSQRLERNGRDGTICTKKDETWRSRGLFSRWDGMKGRA